MTGKPPIDLGRPSRPDPGPNASGGPSGDEQRWLEHLAAATDLVAVERFREAEMELLRALSAGARDLRALNLLAMVRFKMGRYDDARTTYREIVSRAPADAAARLSLGLLALKIDRLDEAIHELEAAVKLAPDDAPAWSYLAFAYTRRGDRAAAAAAFRHAGQDALADELETMRPPRAVGVSAGPAVPASSKEPTAGAVAGANSGLASASPSAVPAPGTAGYDDVGEPAPAPSSAAERAAAVESSPGAEEPAAAAPSESAPSAAPGPAAPFAVEAMAAADFAPGDVAPAADLSEDLLEVGPGPLPPPPALADAAAPSPAFPGATGSPGVPLARFVLSSLGLEVPPPFPEGAVLHLPMDPDVHVRADAVLATTGADRWNRGSRRVRGRLTGAPLGLPALPFFRVVGPGTAVVAGPADRWMALALEDDIFYLREDRVLAFDGGVLWESGRVPGGGLRMIQFRGRGLVVVQLDGTTTAIKVGETTPALVNQAHLLGWVGRVIVQQRREVGASAGDAERVSTPPAPGVVPLWCQGEGVVLLELGRGLPAGRAPDPGTL